MFKRIVFCVSAALGLALGIAIEDARAFDCSEGHCTCGGPAIPNPEDDCDDMLEYCERLDGDFTCTDPCGQGCCQGTCDY